MLIFLRTLFASLLSIYLSEQCSRTGAHRRICFTRLQQGPQTGCGFFGGTTSAMGCTEFSGGTAFLHQVGRMQEGLTEGQRAVELDRLSAGRTRALAPEPPEQARASYF